MRGNWRIILANGLGVNLVRARIWFRRIKTRQRLRELELRELDDAGLTECERRHECAKWFWQA